MPLDRRAASTQSPIGPAAENDSALSGLRAGAVGRVKTDRERLYQGAGFVADRIGQAKDIAPQCGRGKPQILGEGARQPAEPDKVHHRVDGYPVAGAKRRHIGAHGDHGAAEFMAQDGAFGGGPLIVKGKIGAADTACCNLYDRIVGASLRGFCQSDLDFAPALEPAYLLHRHGNSPESIMLTYIMAQSNAWAINAIGIAH